MTDQDRSYRFQYITPDEQDRRAQQWLADKDQPHQSDISPALPPEIAATAQNPETADPTACKLLDLTSRLKATESRIGDGLSDGWGKIDVQRAEAINNLEMVA